MERMGHSEIVTTPNYLHTLPDTDDTAMAAFESVRGRASTPLPRRQRHAGNLLRDHGAPDWRACQLHDYCFIVLPHSVTPVSRPDALGPTSDRPAKELQRFKLIMPMSKPVSTKAHS
jgi:hypothetical protein